MSHTIAVTGATGALGRHVVQTLLRDGVQPERIVAIVRRPEAAEEFAKQGVHVRFGDYFQPESLRKALHGVQRVLLISSNDFNQRAAQHQAVIDAAKATAVEHLAYTSILRCDSNPMILAFDHKTTERAVRESGLTFTILRNGWYFENYTENFEPALAHNTFIGCAGSGKIAAATRADFAQAAANVLTGDGHEGKTYELHGDSAFTMAQLAEAVSSWAGRLIGYADLPKDTYQSALEQGGVPTGFATVLVDADLAIQQGILDVKGDDLSTLIQRPTTSLEHVLASMEPPKTAEPS